MLMLRKWIALVFFAGAVGVGTSIGCESEESLEVGMREEDSAVPADCFDLAALSPEELVGRACRLAAGEYQSEEGVERAMRHEEAVHRHLIRAGSAGLQALRVAIRDEDNGSLRGALLNYLAGFGGAEVEEILREVAKSRLSEHDLVVVSSLLQDVKSDWARTYAMRLSTSSVWTVRANAVGALGNYHASSVSRRLLEVLSTDPVDGVRRNALLALGQGALQGSTAELHAICVAMSSTSSQVREAGLQVLNAVVERDALPEKLISEGGQEDVDWLGWFRSKGEDLVWNGRLKRYCAERG